MSSKKIKDKRRVKEKGRMKEKKRKRYKAREGERNEEMGIRGESIKPETKNDMKESKIQHQTDFGYYGEPRNF